MRLLAQPEHACALRSELLLSNWRTFGPPDYAQFDNGSVIRICLSPAVTPVFAVPREFDIQSAIESYNDLLQQKVCHRFHFETVEDVQIRSDNYVAAVQQKRRQRQERAPRRRTFPAEWIEPEALHRQGQDMFLRRTTRQGTVELLGREHQVRNYWCHRLVRCEMDLCRDHVSIYGLHRQAPEEQPLLRK